MLAQLSMILGALVVRSFLFQSPLGVSFSNFPNPAISRIPIVSYQPQNQKGCNKRNDTGSHQNGFERIAIGNCSNQVSGENRPNSGASATHAANGGYRMGRI